MAYAVRNDGLGWRAVNSSADCTANEAFSTTIPAQAFAQQWVAYQHQARSALAATDATMHRLGEGVALGVTSWTAADVVVFVNYRRALRAILSQGQPAAIPASLPTRPPFPAGT